jgi:hypothetical protein
MPLRARAVCSFSPFAPFRPFRQFGGSTGQLNQMARKKREAERITEASAAMSEELAALQVRGRAFLKNNNNKSL